MNNPTSESQNVGESVVQSPSIKKTGTDTDGVIYEINDEIPIPPLNEGKLVEDYSWASLFQFLLLIYILIESVKQYSKKQWERILIMTKDLHTMSSK